MGLGQVKRGSNPRLPLDRDPATWQAQQEVIKVSRHGVKWKRKRPDGTQEAYSRKHRLRRETVAGASVFHPIQGLSGFIVPHKKEPRYREARGSLKGM